MIIRDKRTNEKIDMGDRNPRLSKLARRVYAFSEAIKKLEDVREFDMKMITLTYAPDREWPEKPRQGLSTSYEEGDKRRSPGLCVGG